MWSHRERVLAVLSHRQPDRVPIDFGSAHTSINVKGYETLKQYLSLEESTDTSIMSTLHRHVIVDEELLTMFDVDTRSLCLPQNGQSPQLTQFEENPDLLTDEWGVVHKYSKEMGSYAPYRGPFQGERTADWRELEHHEWPHGTRLGAVSDELFERAVFLHEETDYAVVLALPLGVVHRSQYLRGHAEWLMDLLRKKDFAMALMGRVVDIWCETVATLLSRLGPYVDVVTWGDDLGTQHSPLVSPEIYRRLIWPFHKRMCDTLRAAEAEKVVLHTCGSVMPFVEDFVTLGLDGINPIQLTARGMEAKALKDKTKGRLALWGGIDTQHLLPSGTVQEVEYAVKEAIEQLGQGGGYMLAPTNIIQRDVPPVNIVTMLRAGLKWGMYG